MQNLEKVAKICIVLAFICLLSAILLGNSSVNFEIEATWCFVGFWGFLAFGHAAMYIAEK